MKSRKKQIAFLLVIVWMMGLICAPLNPTFVSAANNESTITIRVDGEANQISGYHEDDTFWVADSDIILLTGIKPEKYSKTFSGKTYYDLCMYAYEADYTYFSYDKVLNQVYMWSEERYDGQAYEMACHVMNTIVKDMSDVYEKSTDGNNILTAHEYMKMTDVCVKALDKKRIDEWQSKYELLRESDEELTKADGAYILLYLAEFLGGDFCKMELGYYYDLINQDGEAHDWLFNTKLFNDIGENDYHVSTYGWPRCASAQFYTMGRYIDENNKQVILEYDANNNSFHEDEWLSAKLGLELLINNINANYEMMHYDICGSNGDSNKCSFVSFDEAKCSTPSEIINEKIISLSNANKNDSDNYETGYILQVYDETPQSLYEVKEYTIRHIAEWGYKRIRLQIGYQHLFNEELTSYCPENFAYLDQLIAYGIKYNVKIELNFADQPGWWLNLDENYRYTGAVDIIRNEEHRNQAKLMWKILAKRYQTVPSSALEFDMFWEYGNWLRTNAGDFVDEYPEYSQDEIVAALADLTSAVKEADPNRQMTMETAMELSADPYVRTDNLATKYALDNQIIPSANYASLWIYSSLAATGTDDRVRANYPKSWPSNYYEMPGWFMGAGKGNEQYAVPLILTGDLVSGAEIHLFIDAICTAGTIRVLADDKEIYQEKINPTEDITASYQDDKYQYEQDRKMIVPNYIETSKDIHFTLDESAEEIEIYYEVDSTDANPSIYWSGIKVDLPKTYEQKKWLFVPGYETTLEDSPFYGMEQGFLQQSTSSIYIGNNGFSDEFIQKLLSEDNVQIPQIPIILDAESLSFSTESISYKYDLESVENSIKEYKQHLPENAKFIMRYEGPFDSVESKDWNAYEKDVLSTLQKNNISWLSNDYGNILITENSPEKLNIVGAEFVPYYEYSGLNVELLKIHNQYKDEIGYQESNGHMWKCNGNSMVDGKLAYTYSCSICNTEKTIKVSELEKEEHDFSKYVSIENGKHKVVCKDCGAVQEGHDNDSCSGGTATCKEKAKCDKCGADYGDLAAHFYDTKWSADGTNHWHACTVCGAKEDSASHTLETTTTKATLTANGKQETKCSICGKVTENTTIYAAKTINLFATKYTYDGKYKKPSVIIKDSKGNTISSSNYTVTYPSGRKNVGKYTIKVTFKGDYRGSKKLTFTINPPKTSISKLKAGKKAFTVKWAKKTTQVTGYEIQYSASSTFKSGNKTVKVTSAKTVFKTISKLKGGKKYYVRIRTYKTVRGKKYYSDWSAKKSVKTKK